MRCADWKAFCRKWQAVGCKERLRLVGKLGARLLGIRKCLFLGGYRQEEDRRQEESDRAIAAKLYEKAEAGDGFYAVLKRRKDDWLGAAEQPGCEEQPGCDERTVDEEGSLRKLLTDRGSYIAIVTEHLDTGGLEEVVCLLALQCHEQRMPVEVFCLYTGGRIATRLQQAGVTVRVFWGDRERLQQYVSQRSPWLVNTHYVIDFLDVFRERQIPVVDVIHNMYVFLDEKRLAVEQQKAEMIFHYIAVSESAKQFFCQKVNDLAEKKICVIGNAPLKRPAISVVAEQGKLREKFHLPREGMVFLAAGSIDARKNQLGLLRAWAIAREFQEEPAILVLAGAGSDPEYERKIHQMIQEKHLEEQVRLLGFCNRMAELMGAADVFVVDSYYEGWSMAATEALYSGLPLIHADCGSGRELTAGGENGILVSSPLHNLSDYSAVALYDAMHAGLNDNIEELTVALLLMMRQKKYWHSRREQIRGYAQKHFSVEQMWKKYVTVYWDAAQRADNRGEDREEKAEEKNDGKKDE